MTLNVLIVSNSQHHIAPAFAGVAARVCKHSPTHVHCEQKAAEELGEKKYDVVFVDDLLEGPEAESDEMAVDVARKLKQASPKSWVYVLKKDIDSFEEGPDGISGYFPKRAEWIDYVFEAASE